MLQCFAVCWHVLASMAYIAVAGSTRVCDCMLLTSVTARLRWPACTKCICLPAPVQRWIMEANRQRYQWTPVPTQTDNRSITWWLNSLHQHCHHQTSHSSPPKALWTCSIHTRLPRALEVNS